MISLSLSSRGQPRASPCRVRTGAAAGTGRACCPVVQQAARQQPLALVAQSPSQTSDLFAEEGSTRDISTGNSKQLHDSSSSSSSSTAAAAASLPSLCWQRWSRCRPR